MSSNEMSAQAYKREIARLNPLTDVPSERLVLSSILTNGDVAYYKLTEIVEEGHFSVYENKLVYNALKVLIEDRKIAKPNLAVLVAAIRDIDKASIDKYELPEYLGALQKNAVSIEEALPLCQKLLKFSVARDLRERIETAKDNLEDISGTETIMQIISIVENPITDFYSTLLHTEDTINLSEFLVEHVQNLIDNPQGTLGIPSGFPQWDRAIGGGLRKSGFQLIGARSKGGKSFLALNMAHYITSRAGVTPEDRTPVLYLDTELTKTITTNRWVSRLTDLDTVEDLETGLFAHDEEKLAKVQNAIASATNRQFFYQNISGKPHTEWLSIMRRWLVKHVGFNPDGQVKDCVIILDYIKLMDLKETKQFAEHQFLGQIATDLHNFCNQYGVSMVVLCQLNREGINREDQGVISGSDRLMYLCSSFTILKNKSPEDFADDPEEYGDKKLMVVDCRNGPSHDFGEYINVKTDLAKAKMVEGNSNVQNRVNGSGRRSITRDAEQNAANTNQEVARPANVDDVIPF